MREWIWESERSSDGHLAMDYTGVAPQVWYKSVRGLEEEGGGMVKFETETINANYKCTRNNLPYRVELALWKGRHVLVYLRHLLTGSFTLTWPTWSGPWLTGCRRLRPVQTQEGGEHWDGEGEDLHGYQVGDVTLIGVFPVDGAGSSREFYRVPGFNGKVLHMVTWYFFAIHKNRINQK